MCNAPKRRPAGPDRLDHSNCRNSKRMSFTRHTVAQVGIVSVAKMGIVSELLEQAAREQDGGPNDRARPWEEPCAGSDVGRPVQVSVATRLDFGAATHTGPTVLRRGVQHRLHRSFRKDVIRPGKQDKGSCRGVHANVSSACQARSRVFQQQVRDLSRYQATTVRRATIHDYQFVYAVGAEGLQAEIQGSDAVLNTDDGSDFGHSDAWEGCCRFISISHFSGLSKSGKAAVGLGPAEPAGAFAFRDDPECVPRGPEILLDLLVGVGKGRVEGLACQETPFEHNLGEERGRFGGIFAVDVEVTEGGMPPTVTLIPASSAASFQPA